MDRVMEQPISYLSLMNISRFWVTDVKRIIPAVVVCAT